MNDELKEAMTAIIQRWRTEPITMADGAVLAAQWAYEDSAKLVESSGYHELAKAIRNRGK